MKNDQTKNEPKKTNHTIFVTNCKIPSGNMDKYLEIWAKY